MGCQSVHCHADNAIFDSKAFVEEIHNCGQTILCCAVNAHHQNGKAEKKIRDLQDLARTNLLHTKQRWPDAITFNLWMFAIGHANDILNASLSQASPEASAIEIFSGIKIKPQVKHSHTFGSPVCVLSAPLQAGKRIGKWNNGSRVGLCLGTLPRHSRKVSLVLNLRTGLVSPQFHCAFDDLCDTLRPASGNFLPRSKWQGRAGLELLPVGQHPEMDALMH